MTATEDPAVPPGIRADRTGMLALWGANGISMLGVSMTIRWWSSPSVGSGRCRAVAPELHPVPGA